MNTSLLYCYIDGVEINSVFKYQKPEDFYGKVFINLVSEDGKHYQVHGDAAKNIVIGGENLFIDFEKSGLREEFYNSRFESINTYVIHRLTGKIEEFISSKEKTHTINSIFKEIKIGYSDPYNNGEFKTTEYLRVTQCGFGSKKIKEHPIHYNGNIYTPGVLAGTIGVLILILFILIIKMIIKRKKKK